MVLTHQERSDATRVNRRNDAFTHKANWTGTICILTVFHLHNERLCDAKWNILIHHIMIQVVYLCHKTVYYITNTFFSLFG